MKTLSPYAKAVAAFLLTALTSIGAVYADGQITGKEWVQVAIATLTTTAAVFGVPNAGASPFDEQHVGTGK